VYCIMPIHQEKKWETWELRRLLLGKANPKKKEDCPTDGMWDSLALTVLPPFFCSFFVLSLLVSSALRYYLIWEREERESFFIVSSVCVCVCVLSLYTPGLLNTAGPSEFSIYYIERNEPF
jgi:hypothetical protein